MRIATTLAIVAILTPFLAAGQTSSTLNDVQEVGREGIDTVAEATHRAALAGTMQPKSDGIGYVVIPFGRSPLLVTPPVVGADGRIALLILLTNFPSLAAASATLQAFGPAGELVYDQQAPLYSDAGDMTSALAFFELIPAQGSGQVEVTVGSHHFQVSVGSKDWTGFVMGKVCPRDDEGSPEESPCNPPDLEDPCARLPCDPNPCERLPCGRDPCETLPCHLLYDPLWGAPPRRPLRRRRLRRRVGRGRLRRDAVPFHLVRVRALELPHRGRVPAAAGRGSLVY